MTETSRHSIGISPVNGGFGSFALHSAPGVLSVTPRLTSSASEALLSADTIALWRPFHKVVVHGDMSGDLGSVFPNDIPRPDLTMISVAAVLEAAGKIVDVWDQNATRSSELPIFQFSVDAVLVKVQLATWRDDLRSIAILRQTLDIPIILFGSVVSYLIEPDRETAVLGDAVRALTELFHIDRFVVGKAYRLFPIGQYKDASGDSRAHLQGSRGCARTCRYCPYIRVHGRWAGRDLEDLANDLAAIKGLGFKVIQFRDQDFASDATHAMAVSNLVRKIGNGEFNWTAEGNLDLFTPEVVHAMKSGGCNEVVVGIESTDPDVLRGARRRRLTDLEERVRSIVQTGVAVRGLFIVGLPSDDRRRFAATVRSAIALPLLSAHFSVYYPLPAEEFGADHLVEVDDFERDGNNLYRYQTCAALLPNEVRDMASSAETAFQLNRIGDPRWRDIICAIEGGGKLVE